MLERISAGRAGAICGFSAKTMRKLAQEGKIPGAVLLGNRWRFDECRLREWIKEREDECQTSTQRVSSTERTPGTRECRFVAGTYDEAYERLLGRRPKLRRRRDD